MKKLLMLIALAGCGILSPHTTEEVLCEVEYVRIGVVCEAVVAAQEAGAECRKTDRQVEVDGVWFEVWECDSND